ncbi:MAG: DUF2793 domain-containing protein [Pseudomonadota bacterium]
MSEFETPNLALPYIAAAQAQKHVTHNEAIRRPDAIVQLSVVSRTALAPPASPQDGERHIVPQGATGNWAGEDGKVAARQDNAWTFLLPQDGRVCFVQDENSLLAYHNGIWQPVGSQSAPTSPSMLGINSSATPVQRLAVSSDSVLLNHDGDDMRLAMNRAGAADTTSLLFQTGFTGNAEIGLTGNDALSFKTSPDGTNWTEAIQIDPAHAVPVSPQRPFFRARPASTFTNVPAGGGQLAFGSIVNQTGTAYDAANSQFTAPMDGVYSFSVQARFDTLPSGGYVRLYLEKNGDHENFSLGHVIDGNAHSTNYHSMSISSHLLLQTGDIITVQGGHISGSHSMVSDSMWSGTLIG